MPLIAVIRQLHLYTALILGAVFSVFGLAGSWLAFYPHLDGALLDFATDTRWSAERVSWNETYRAAQTATGPASGMNGIMMPFGDRGPVIVFNQTRAEATTLDYNMVYVDPGNARVLSAREMLSSNQSLTRNLTGIAYAIHSGLIVGPAGHVVVALLGVFLLFVIVTGLVLWWPRGKWRRSAFLLLSGVGSRAFIADLHRIFGLYASFFLSLLVITGIYYALPDVVTRAVSAVLPVTARAQHSMSMHASDHSTHHGADLDRAVATARAAFPERELQMLMAMPNGFVQVNLAPRAGASRVGATEVGISPDGALLTVRDPSRETVADTVLRWLMPLHTGAAFDTLGRAIVCFLGFMPVAFFITGIIIWLRRTRARRQRVTLRHHPIATH